MRGELTEQLPPEDGRAQPEPQVYVTRLDGYKNGEAPGVWLNAAVGSAALLAAAETELGFSDEYVIEDARDFGGFEVPPSAPLAYVADVASGIREHGSAFGHWARLVRRTEFFSDFASHYFGFWPTPAEWACSFMQDLGLGQELAPLTPGFRPYLYVDYAAFARDLRERGEITWREADGGVHVFLTPWRLGDHREEEADGAERQGAVS